MLRPRSRHLVTLAGGIALFEWSRVLARRGSVTPAEESIFRAANEASDPIRIPTRAVMQAGSFGAVPVASALAFLAGRRRLAAGLAVGGSAAWLLAKAAKPLGGRPRPGGVLDDVRTREGIQGDLGWVSGHTAVATTLAMTASPWVPRWARPALGGIVAATGFGRMYVGAHLPLDLVGGAGLGIVISAVVRMRSDP